MNAKCGVLYTYYRYFVTELMICHIIRFMAGFYSDPEGRIKALKCMTAALLGAHGYKFATQTNEYQRVTRKCHLPVLLQLGFLRYIVYLMFSFYSLYEVSIRATRAAFVRNVLKIPLTH